MNSLKGFTALSDLGLLILRVVLGVIFISHGMMKWEMWNMQPSEHMSASMLTIMRILSISEPLGGLALILGFLSLFASIGLSISMLGAIYIKIAIMHTPFISMHALGWEFDLILIAGLFCIMFVSAGKISIDNFLFTNRKNESSVKGFTPIHSH